MKIFKKAKWLTDPEFVGIPPLNLLRKANAEPESAKPDEELLNRHLLVRKTFTCREPEKTIIRITADDYYKLYINGTFVGQGPAPGYHFHYNVNEYDISELLQTGENIIAVHVYYQGLINRVWCSGDNRMGLGAEVISGSEVVAHTDSTWKYHIAKEFVGRETTGYDTQFIDVIDNRKKKIGWKQPAFDDSGWDTLSVNDNADYTFYLQATPSVEVYSMLPVSIRAIKAINESHPSGEGSSMGIMARNQPALLIDFGQEITGGIIFAASGKSGDEIEIHYGEELESPDKVRSDMRCNCKYIDKLVLSGNDDIYESFDYKGFRYVQILPGAAVAHKESIIAEVRHYPYNEKHDSFFSPNRLINQIWDICKNAVKFGTQEGFLDCPTREKGQYLGDATIIAQAHAYLTEDLRIYKKCLHDFALSARICPGLMAVAPGNFMQEIADYSLQWPLQLLKYHELSGDTEFLRDMLPVADGLISYFGQFARADGLLENFKDKPIMVDWPPNLRDNYDYKLMPEYQDGCNTVLNAFYIGAVRAVSQIKDILDIAYDDEFDSLKSAYNNTFYDCENSLFRDSEISLHHSLHANVLSLFFDLSPLDSKKIIGFIKRKRFSCGVYFAYFVLKALAKADEYEFIYELLTSKDERSWGNMIKEGATACFEAWGKEQKWNTSLCHPWASSPIIILTEHSEIINYELT
jgi:hypothetical protein